jgi:hypothetical protein
VTEINASIPFGYVPVKFEVNRRSLFAVFKKYWSLFSCFYPSTMMPRNPNHASIPMVHDEERCHRSTRSLLAVDLSALTTPTTPTGILAIPMDCGPDQDEKKRTRERL